MKLFCGCKAECSYEYAWNPNEFMQIMVSETYYDEDIPNCKLCNWPRWYDANYENMMFDLRNMNQM